MTYKPMRAAVLGVLGVVTMSVTFAPCATTADTTSPAARATQAAHAALSERVMKTQVTSTSVSAAASPGAQSWLRRYDGPAHSTDRALASTSFGEVIYVTGESTGAGTGSDLATQAYDVAGNVLWTNRYNETFERPSDIAVSADGSKVFVTGQTVEASVDYLTVAYATASGAQLWASRYDSPAAASDSATALAVSQDGTKVLVTGQSGDGGGGHDYATVAYNASNGSLQWAKRYSPNNLSSLPADIAIAPNSGGVVVTGSTDTSSPEQSDYATVAYSLTGTQLWVKRYNGPASGDDYATATKVSPDATMAYVSGLSAGTSPCDGCAALTTIAYRLSDGAKTWVKRSSVINAPSIDPLYTPELTLSPDGSRIFVAGTRQRFSKDYLLVAYSKAGTLLWSAGYNTKDNRGIESDDRAHAVAVNRDGTQVYVTGDSHWNDLNDSDYATLAFNAATGSRLWVRRYDGTSTQSLNWVKDLTVTPALVAVTGFGPATNADLDFETVAYTIQ